jgi:hypothetical protein
MIHVHDELRAFLEDQIKELVDRSLEIPRNTLNRILFVDLGNQIRALEVLKDNIPTE